MVGGEGYFVSRSTIQITLTPDPSPINGEGRRNCGDTNAARGEGTELRLFSRDRELGGDQGLPLTRSLRAPQPDFAVVERGGESEVVRREGEVINLAGDIVKAEQLLPGVDVPEPDGAVHPAGGERPPIR